MRIELSENIKNKILKIFTKCAEEQTENVIVLRFQNNVSALDLRIFGKAYTGSTGITAYLDSKNVEIQLDRMLEALSEIGC